MSKRIGLALILVVGGMLSGLLALIYLSVTATEKLPLSVVFGVSGPWLLCSAVIFFIGILL